MSLIQGSQLETGKCYKFMKENDNYDNQKLYGEELGKFLSKEPVGNPHDPDVKYSFQNNTFTGLYENVEAFSEIICPNVANDNNNPVPDPTILKDMNNADTNSDRRSRKNRSNRKRKNKH